MNNTISTNLRMRYNPKEGTDLYVVLNQGLNTDRKSRLDPHLPVVEQPGSNRQVCKNIYTMTVTYKIAIIVEKN